MTLSCKHCCLCEIYTYVDSKKEQYSFLSHYRVSRANVLLGQICVFVDVVTWLQFSRHFRGNKQLKKYVHTGRLSFHQFSTLRGHNHQVIDYIDYNMIEYLKDQTLKQALNCLIHRSKYMVDQLISINFHFSKL